MAFLGERHCSIQSHQWSFVAHFHFTFTSFPQITESMKENLHLRFSEKSKSNHKIIVYWLVEFFVRRMVVCSELDLHWGRNCFSRSLMSIYQVGILLTENSRLPFYVPLDLCGLVNVIIMQNRPLNVLVHFELKPFELTTMPALNTPYSMIFFHLEVKVALRSLWHSCGYFYQSYFGCRISLMRLSD